MRNVTDETKARLLGEMMAAVREEGEAAARKRAAVVAWNRVHDAPDAPGADRRKLADVEAKLGDAQAAIKALATRVAVLEANAKRAR